MTQFSSTPSLTRRAVLGAGASGAVLAHIRDNAADVCIGIEGMNEPNNNRDGSPLPADWAVKAVAYQKAIADFVAAPPSMAHVRVVGPSLHLGGADPLKDCQ